MRAAPLRPRSASPAPDGRSPSPCPTASSAAEAASPQAPDLVLQFLVLALGRGQPRGQLLVLFPEPLDLADQSANQPDQLGRAQSLKRITRSRRHSELESYFQALDSSPPPQNLPLLL